MPPQNVMMQPPAPQPQMQMQPPMAPKRNSGIWYLAAAIVISLAALGASFFYVNMARGNADYICTYVIEDEGDCTNGSWGGWTAASTTATTCSTRTVERRTYTGTRTTRHILQYLNLRTACDAGYTQTQYGDSGGDSGFHGGTIVSESTACQIEETRVTVAPTGAPSCSSSSGDGVQATSTTVTSAQIDVGDPQSQQSAVTAKDQLNAFRESMIKADITAVPLLVSSGDTTMIKWQGREVKECTVSSPNGDTWEGTAGEKRSRPLSEQTTYTLTCTAFNDTTVTDSVTINITPTFQEE